MAGLLGHRCTGRSKGLPMSDVEGTLEVSDNPELSRYEALLDGRAVGLIAYRRNGDVLEMVHAEVDPSVEGRGVGTQMATAALDDVRARALRIEPRCPFIVNFLERHPDYRSLVAS